jgi:hypothetical protein
VTEAPEHKCEQCGHACQHRELTIDLDRAQFSRVCVACRARVVECSLCEVRAAGGPWLRDSEWRAWGWTGELWRIYGFMRGESRGQQVVSVRGHWCPQHHYMEQVIGRPLYAPDSWEYEQLVELERRFAYARERRCQQIALAKAPRIETSDDVVF